LGENFIKCFFRYYGLLSAFISELFILKAKKEEPKLAQQLMGIIDRF
jgi:hypothetical protein